MRRAVVLAVSLLLIAPAARAGGDFVDLAVGGHTLWFVGSFGVRGIDAGSGRIVRTPQLSAASYPLSVAVTGDEVWVASVENGFVAGKLSRIDLRAGQRRVVLNVPTGSVQSVSSGGGGVYALVADRSRNQIVLLSRTGRRVRSWIVPDPGRMAGDASGCWVSAGGALFHIDVSGRMHTVLRATIGDIVTGEDAAWLALDHTIVRVDERTGRVQTLQTGPLHLGGFQHDVAVGDNALWTLDTLPPALQQRDIATGKIVRSVRLPDLADAVVATPTGIWVGTSNSHLVLRFDPRTLRRTLTVRAGF